MSSVYVDITCARPGIVTSRHALAVLEFIESCGGAPDDALALLFRRSRLLLAKLRGAGMIYRARAGGMVLWLPAGVSPPLGAEHFRRMAAVGWLAARLKEAGGRYEKGSAIFPNGAAFPVALVPPTPQGHCLAVMMEPGKVFLEKGSVSVFWEDLRVAAIKECLRAV
ncbi:MAG: hypothetical protein M1130_05125 [Actinobacteria bacterium]|nr:hypothetical protein [Actinomycetota bacterium]